MQPAAIMNNQLFRVQINKYKLRMFIDKADWLGQYFQSQDIDLRANTIINVTIKVGSVWSCNCIMFEKAFYAVVDRLGLVSYHLVFFYSCILKEFKRNLLSFLIGQVLHGSIFLLVQLCNTFLFLYLHCLLTDHYIFSESNA